MQRLRIAVMVSGGGSNLQAIIDAISGKDLPVEIACVISNRKDAFALQRAKKFDIEAYYIGMGSHPDASERELALFETLAAENVDLIVLAGYLSILPKRIIDAYRKRIINIHPALIPKYCGPGFYGHHVHEAVIASGDTHSGATTHFVDEGVDTGEIIYQSSVAVAEGDTAETLSHRVLRIEHELLVKTLEDIANGRVKIGGGMQKRALISVSDKTGIVEFAQALHEMGIELISTGGTEKSIKEAGIPVKNISEITHFPECLDGRVKTLHPVVHGGILAIRSNPDHMKQLEELSISTIDYVIINLYPFKETVLKPGVHFEEAVENIDIGGPTMLRSAAKNHADVVVVIDPSDYTRVITELKEHGEVPYETKFDLALKVFQHTAHYDAMIASYLVKHGNRNPYPETLTLTYEKVQGLRYGENPHQNAAFYKEVFDTKGTLSEAVQLHGKELSYNNINDVNGAIALLKEFEDKATVVAVKHSSPCGVGSGFDIYHAYTKAYDCDPVSIFGGIVAANKKIDLRTAQRMNEIFLEIVIAPDFDADALECLKTKKNLRVLQLKDIKLPASTLQKDVKKTLGGLLIQDIDSKLLEGELVSVTERIPTKKEIEELMFAWKVCKHAKSNGIVISKDHQTIGLGQGQVSRVWATENAIRQSNFPTKGAVLASDAFFPFADGIKAAAEAGISAIIQPGGSVKDQDVIDEANKYGMAMVFTGMRHFKH
jgi:phosphoribosylaminoimidazolecarboxamide formyltransferase/IMP cyclohydrolase